MILMASGTSKRTMARRRKGFDCLHFLLINNEHRYCRESLRDVLAQKKKEGRQDRRPGPPAEEFAHDRLVIHAECFAQRLDVGLVS